jgi:hypothetical protein
MVARRFSSDPLHPSFRPAIAGPMTAGRSAASTGRRMASWPTWRGRATGRGSKGLKGDGSSHALRWTLSGGEIGVFESEPGLIMAGGDQDLDALIRGVKRGILVTRFWYIRMVDPQTELYTGLTRDGTFYVENGEIKFAVKNFRFNESPVIMLNNLEALGRPQRVNASPIPPMVVRDSTFSSLSDAVWSRRGTMSDRH